MPDRYGRETTNELFTRGFRGESREQAEKRRKKAVKKSLKKEEPSAFEKATEGLLEKVKAIFDNKRREPTVEEREAARARYLRRLRERRKKKQVPSLGISKEEASAIKKGFNEEE